MTGGAGDEGPSRGAVSCERGGAALPASRRSIGLHLFAGRRWTGRQVQRARMEPGHRMKAWPALPPPGERAAPNVAGVLAAPEGTARDAAIEDWARAVWKTWGHAHARIRELMEGRYRDRAR